MADDSAVIVVIGGQTVTPFARVGQVRIEDVLNDAPNTAALTLVSAPRFGPSETGPFAAHAFDLGAFATATNHAPIMTPPPIVPGAPVAIYLGAVDPARQIFGGLIASREQFHEFDQPQHVRYHVSAVNYTRLLNRRKVLKDYGAASATAIVLNLVATFAPMITVAHVAPGLPTITGGITFTFEDVSRSLSRLAEKIGAYWYINYQADLHFFTGTEAGTEPAPLVPGADFADLKIAADLSQVRTRILIEGDGATALATLPAGDPILPVSVAQPFNPAGGLAKVTTTRFAYTGTHAGGVTVNTVGVGSGGTAPPASPAPASVAVAGSAGKLVGGPYYYAFTFELADGARSAVGGDTGPVTIGGVPAPATTIANLITPPVKGPIAVGVSSRYAQSFVTAGGGETPATTGGPLVTGRIVAPPTLGIVNWFSNAASQIVPGFYSYAMTYLTPGGETTPAQTTQAIQIPSTAEVRIGATIATDQRVVGRRFYRSSVGGPGAATLPWRHLGDIPNNVNTTFIDTSADATLSPMPIPVYNSAHDVAEGATVELRVSSDPRVIRRRVYRQDGSGHYRLIAEIPDNTATVFTDVVVGGGGAIAPTENVTASGAIAVSNIAIGPAGTVRRRVFRNTAGGGDYRELTALHDNTTTAITDTTPDSNLGGSPLPPQGGAGAGAPPTAAGSPTLRVSDLTGIPAAGWAAVEGQLVRYTGTSTAGGSLLTGIPAAGPGAITADIPAGAVVTSSPALVGVSPAVPITIGDPVQLLAQVNDAAAQAAIAAIEGGDGVIEHYIQDRRLSEAGAIARGQAELALFKTVETTLHYTTHDPNTRSGRTVHAALPAPTSLTGDFLIQRVTIDDVSIATNFYPRRSVEASTTRFSFDDVLNRLLLEQT